MSSNAAQTHDRPHEISDRLLSTTPALARARGIPGPRRQPALQLLPAHTAGGTVHTSSPQTLKPYAVSGPPHHSPRPPPLRQGVKREDFGTLADNAMKDACGFTNPKQPTKDEVIALFTQAFEQ